LAKNNFSVCKKFLTYSFALGALFALSSCSTKNAFNSNFSNELITPSELNSNSIGLSKTNTNIVKQSVVNSTQSANTSVMSLRNVALVALADNPNINIARWQAKGAEANVSIANVKWQPKIEYSIANGAEITYDSKTDTGETHLRREASITLSQLIFDFGKTNADVDWAASLQTSAELRLAYKISSIIYEVTEIYLMVLEHDLLIANARQNERAHKETYRLVSISEQGGNATKADVQKAFTRLEGARTQVIELISARQRTASEFRRVIGFKPGRLKAPRITKNSSATLSIANIDTYIKRNSFMQSLLQDGVALKHQQASLERGYLPQLTLEGRAGAKENVTAVSPMAADARLMVALRGSLYDGGDKYAKLMLIKAQIGEKEARYRKAQLDLENEVAEIIRIIKTAKSKAASINKRIKASEDVVRLYTEQFKAGSRSIFELLDAQQELSVAKAERISNHYDVLRQRYSAQKYIGNLVPNVLGKDVHN